METTVNKTPSFPAFNALFVVDLFTFNLFDGDLMFLLLYILFKISKIL